MNYGLTIRTLLGTVLLAPLVALHAADVQKQTKPNFIVILSDDQSWVGSSLQMLPGNLDSASDYFRTPNIERLAEQGMLFTAGYSPAPLCCPTRRSLQVSQTPARHE